MKATKTEGKEGLSDDRVCCALSYCYSYNDYSCNECQINQQVHIFF